MDLTLYDPVGVGGEAYRVNIDFFNDHQCNISNFTLSLEIIDIYFY